MCGASLCCQRILRDFIVGVLVLPQLVEDAGQDTQHADRPEQASLTEFGCVGSAFDQVLQDGKRSKEAVEEVVGGLDQPRLVEFFFTLAPEGALKRTLYEVTKHALLKDRVDEEQDRLRANNPHLLGVSELMIPTP